MDAEAGRKLVEPERIETGRKGRAGGPIQFDALLRSMLAAKGCLGGRGSGGSISRSGIDLILLMDRERPGLIGWRRFVWNLAQ